MDQITNVVNNVPKSKLRDYGHNNQGITYDQVQVLMSQMLSFKLSMQQAYHQMQLFALQQDNNLTYLEESVRELVKLRQETQPSSVNYPSNMQVSLPSENNTDLKVSPTPQSYDIRTATVSNEMIPSGESHCLVKFQEKEYMKEVEIVTQVVSHYSVVTSIEPIDDVQISREILEYPSDDQINPVVEVFSEKSGTGVIIVEEAQNLIELSLNVMCNDIDGSDADTDTACLVSRVPVISGGHSVSPVEIITGKCMTEIKLLPIPVNSNVNCSRFKRDGSPTSLRVFLHNFAEFKEKAVGEGESVRESCDEVLNDEYKYLGLLLFHGFSPHCAKLENQT